MTAIILCIGAIVFLCFCKISEEFEIIHKDTSPTLKTVWTYWQPMPPPEIVQKCYHNWQTVGECDDVRFLNSDNITEYIPQSEYDKITKASPNLAHRSDFIGLYLLKTYGGTWMDASIYLHKPLFSWLPLGDFFCYQADRFSKDSFCMESFFIHTSKNHPIVDLWYKKLFTNKGDDNKFIKDAEKKYPKITRDMGSNTLYLWVYVAGKLVLLENPELKNIITSKKAEAGPWLESIKAGWDADKTCSILEKNGPCQNCNMTKLWNGPRKKCSLDIVKVEEKFQIPEMEDEILFADLDMVY